MSWTKFDHEDKTTWPPPNRLVFVRLRGSDCGLREWYSIEDVSGWYDEDSDLDDGIEPDDEVHWHPLPAPPV